MAVLTPSTASTSSSRIVAASAVAAPGAAGGGGARGERCVGGAGGRGEPGRFGALQLDDDAVDGSGGMPPVMYNRVTSATALTFSIQKSYRLAAARLEEFLRWRRRTGT